MLRVDPLEFFASLGVDLVVVVLLAFVLFYRRHRDREMAIAIASINITLWALTGALASYTLSLGVGFALFAVISIIRLRSSTATWISMAYLMVGLGSGLIIGLTGFALLEKIEYATFMVAVMAVVDSKYFLRGQRDDEKTSLSFEGTNLDPDYLKSRVEEVLNVDAVSIKVRAVSLAPESTKLDIVYRKRNAKG
ncbi:MAG: DUF4956 domain-containing protein [Actinobacteria bacterium]|uniref:Unannotated protein n=1 Tax=freshwater metagenome TaxID=449393 RepID=A0A6J6CDH7_9ZZZZ|nr:DUF4956 domain-containing protein [Actinomycetota bacterium]MTA30253.1 DUF4956 domain-containing protein [Actinomycetota bacterium]